MGPRLLEILRLMMVRPSLGVPTFSFFVPGLGLYHRGSHSWIFSIREPVLTLKIQFWRGRGWEIKEKERKQKSMQKQGPERSPTN